MAHRRKRRRELTLGTVEVPDDRPDPENALGTKQAYGLLQAALEHIPSSRRTVLLMHEVDQLPVHEVAHALSIPLFTAYSRLRKAREELELATRRLSSSSHGRGRRLGTAPQSKSKRASRCAVQITP